MMLSLILLYISLQCSCNKEMVTILMDIFVQIYQPNLYDDWIKGIYY